MLQIKQTETFNKSFDKYNLRDV